MLKGWKGVQLHFYKRFIDDIFMLWSGTEEELITFLRHYIWIIPSFHIGLYNDF